MEKTSTSEDHGIALLNKDDLMIYSVGISTGGVAEIRMAEANPDRHIIATTLDEKGLKFAKEFIAEKGFSSQIDAKIEDVSKPLPYEDNSFDYIYARLVLHYLPKDALGIALSGLHRTLKPNGKLFVVVRSDQCPDATREGAHFDPQTGLTSGSFVDEENGRLYSYSRYFHSEDSIREYVAQAGFDIQYTQAYDEYLYKDFMHTEVTSRTDNVIELLGVKS